MKKYITGLIILFLLAFNVNYIYNISKFKKTESTLKNVLNNFQNQFNNNLQIPVFSGFIKSVKGEIIEIKDNNDLSGKMFFYFNDGMCSPCLTETFNCINNLDEKKREKVYIITNAKGFLRYENIKSLYNIKIPIWRFEGEDLMSFNEKPIFFKIGSYTDKYFRTFCAKSGEKGSTIAFLKHNI